MSTSWPTVRIPFRCQEEMGVPGPEGGQRREYLFVPVYDHDQPAAGRLTELAPQGELRLTVDNPEIRFDPGRFYNLELTPTARTVGGEG